MRELSWLKLSPGSDGRAPTPRSGHTMTTVGQNIFVFGGMAVKAPGTEKPAEEAVASRPRSAFFIDQSLTQDGGGDGGQPLLFGEGTLGAQPVPSDELWLLKLGSRGSEWRECVKKPRSALQRRDPGNGRLASANGALSTVQWPCPRWGHTATDLGDSRILVIGGFASSKLRLGDAWAYRTIARSWDRVWPPPPPSSSTVDSGTTSRGKTASLARGLALVSVSSSSGCFATSAAAFTTSGAVASRGNGDWSPEDAAGGGVAAAASPSPRGGHCAVLIGGRVWLFGGYGGWDYRRQDLDDLWTLTAGGGGTEGGDDGARWMFMSARGPAPAPRSGHGAVAADGIMLVFGGRSSLREYEDLSALDTNQEPPVWSCCAASPGAGGGGFMSVPRWGAACCAVQTTAGWKAFVFGGLGGSASEDNRQGTPLNDLLVLEPDSRRWRAPPEVGGVPPLPRSDAAITYHDGKGILLLFGGWANGWLDDLFSLPVGPLVGPAYSLLAVSPERGAVTGGAALELSGDGFAPTDDVVVRFGVRGKHVDVQGVFISRTKISCTVPDLLAAGLPPGEIEMRASLAGGGFTVVAVIFTAFPVTVSSMCFVYGPGVLEGGCSGRETVFIIQARDADGQNRQFGGDEFDIVIRPASARSERGSDNDGGGPARSFRAAAVAAAARRLLPACRSGG
ncbi:unnamed protein product [Phaeothamnion confervicola]